MDNLKHFLIVDNSVQWFSAIISIKEKDLDENPESLPVYESDNLDSSIQGELLSNIYTRALHFKHRKFFGRISSPLDFSYGWAISEKEFNLVKRLIELKPLFNEYNEILNCK